MDVLDRDKPLSQCLIWPLIEKFYGESGPEAWAQTPYYPTSNAFIADTYAELTLAFLRDRLPELRRDEPIYCVELASGLGAFALLFWRALERKRAEDSALAALDLRYVLTDFTEKNLEHWWADPQLRAEIERGVLDSALYWPERDTQITLRKSGAVLSTETLANPLIVIANYFFDSIRHDFFQAESGTLREALPIIWRDYGHANLPPRLDQLHFTDAYRDIDTQRYYAQPRWNAVLEHYRTTLSEASFLFPIGALAVLDRLWSLTKGRFFLLAADKGFHTEVAMHGHYATPYTPHTGSFSYAVNFHALARYVDNLGGRSWSAHENSSLTTFVATSDVGPSEALSRAAWHYLQENDVIKNSFALAELLSATTPKSDADPASLLRIGIACVELSRFDSFVFASCGEYLQKGLAVCPREVRAALRVLLARVEANLSPLVLGAQDAYGWLRYLYFHLDQLDDCLRVSAAAVALFGPNHDDAFYRGAVAEARGDRAGARVYFGQALEHDPSSEITRTRLALLG
nr:hypothetical protein [Armatimonas sp.]